MRKGSLIYEEMRQYLIIYEEAVSQTWLCTRAPFWISLYMRKLLFYFLSVHYWLPFLCHVRQNIWVYTCEFSQWLLYTQYNVSFCVSFFIFLWQQCRTFSTDFFIYICYRTSFAFFSLLRPFFLPSFAINKYTFFISRVFSFLIFINCLSAFLSFFPVSCLVSPDVCL